MGIIGLPNPREGLAATKPETAGISQDIALRLERFAETPEGSGLHALLVARNSRLVFERYFAGADARWGEALGIVEHGPDRLHDVRSVTKSIVGLLYGMALSEGLVPGTHEKLVDHYPAHPTAAADPLKRRITIGHVLSMRMGLEWKEDSAYDDPNNGEILMERATDRYRFILELPMASKPGAKWNYCGGATALLGNLIERGTGSRLEDYLESRLLRPLGISQFEWITGSDGRAAASSGLRFRPHDLVRIGQMILDRGLWNGTRVVPAGWLAASFKPRAVVEAGLRYGYQWWIGKLLKTGKPWHAAFGNGGQRIITVPSLKMTVIVLAGNYNKTDQWKLPANLMKRVVMPSVLWE